MSVNGKIKQDAALSEMIWDIPNVISLLSGYYALFAGDLIFTGTPSGVGPVNRGDKLVASVTGLTELNVEIV